MRIHFYSADPFKIFTVEKTLQGIKNRKSWYKNHLLEISFTFTSSSINNILTTSTLIGEKCLCVYMSAVRKKICFSYTNKNLYEDVQDASEAQIFNFC